MRKSDANAANHQDVKTPRKKRQNVAGNKQNKQADEQPPALHFAGQQHKRQRHQRHHPRINGEHHAHLGGFHAEAAGNIGQQTDRGEFCGVKNKRGDGQRHDT